MTGKRWTWCVAVLAGGLMVANGAAAATSRGVMTQISNNLGRVVRPVQRQIERLARHRSADRWAAMDAERDGGDGGGSAGSGSASHQRAGEAFQWSKAIPPGKEIEIKGVNGGITASRASGKEVEVHATKHAHKSDPAEVTIEVIEHEDGVTICAKYPGAGNECGPGDKWHTHTHNNDVEVDFEVRVPAGVRLVARTVNGEIRAEGLSSPVEAETVNGAVRVSTSAYASAETINGSITAALGSAEWTEPIAFGTVNGGIHLTLPAKVDADVRARTMNGVVDSDFPVTVTGKLSKHRIQGTIGKGGRRLDLETTNGNISLHVGS